MTGIDGCCARAASGQPAVAPPMRVMKVRRRMGNSKRSGGDNISCQDVQINRAEGGIGGFIAMRGRCPGWANKRHLRYPGREPINSTWAADVRFGAHFGFEQDITALP